MSRTQQFALLAFVGLAAFLANGCREVEHTDSTQVAKAVEPPASRAAAPIPVPGWPDSTFVPTPGWGLPHGGSWTPTQLYNGEGWTIEYPASAKAELREARYSSPRRVIISELPECTYPCIVTVEVHVDSSTTASGTQPASVSAKDTTGGSEDEPDAADDDDEFRVLDTLDLGGARAILYEPYCGDCAARLLITRHGTKVAAIDYNADDRNPPNAALLERLEAILRSFRWTESPQ